MQDALNPEIEEQEAPDPTPVESAQALADAAQGAAATWWNLVAKVAPDAQTFEQAMLTAQRTYPRAFKALVREANPNLEKK